MKGSFMLRESFLITCRPWSGFSEFKSKFKKYQTTGYGTLSQAYQDLHQFESTLTYIQSLKYEKALDGLDRKLNKIIRKQASKQQTFDGFQCGQEKGIFQPQFNVSHTYNYFYRLQNELLNPSIQNSPDALQTLTLSQIYSILYHDWPLHQNSTLTRYHLQLANNLCNSLAIKLLSQVKTRFKYLEEHLCLNMLESYNQFYIKSQQQESSSQRTSALSQLLNKGTSTKKAIHFKGDFKFNLKKQLTADDLRLGTKIAKMLALYNLCGQKTALLVQQCIIDEQYLKKLTPDSLSDILFVLAHQRTPLPKLDEKLFEMFGIFDRVTLPEKKLEYLESLLFYMLATKTQNYSVIENSSNDFNSIINAAGQDMSYLQNMSIYQKQIIVLMVDLLTAKYPQLMSYADQNGVISQFINQIKQIKSNSSEEFEAFLKKAQYPYTKMPASSLNHPDTVFQIEDKKYICLNLSRISNNDQDSKPNGVGQIILQTYHTRSEKVKVINPKLLLDMQKLGQKEEYFLSKMKGVTKPKIVKDRYFGL